MTIAASVAATTSELLLVAHDGWEFSERAVDAAALLARRLDAVVELYSVVPDRAVRSRIAASYVVPRLTAVPHVVRARSVVRLIRIKISAPEVDFTVGGACCRRDAKAVSNERKTSIGPEDHSGRTRGSRGARGT
jgi:hypothetical protein